MTLITDFQKKKNTIHLVRPSLPGGKNVPTNGISKKKKKNRTQCNRFVDVLDDEHISAVENPETGYFSFEVPRTERVAKSNILRARVLL